MPSARLTGAALQLAREKRLLRGVLHEATLRLQTTRDALERELAKASLYNSAARSERTMMACNHANPVDADEGSMKAAAKTLRRAEIIPGKLAKCFEQEERLTELHAHALAGDSDVGSLRQLIEAEAWLSHRLNTFDVDAQPLWGRPKGFLGRVFASPAGVPILVSRQSFSDEVMRQQSRASDLWMQVREGRGSRVMLWLEYAKRATPANALPPPPQPPLFDPGRAPSPAASGDWYASPPMRGCYKGPTRHYAAGSQQCLQMAADLAAYYSEHRQSDEGFYGGAEVIFTDSRRVAARGARVGQMKDSKRLGVLRGVPEAVEMVVHSVEVEQADLL